MNGTMFQRTARCLHLAVLLLAAPLAQAASFQVAPLRLEFTPHQRALALTLTNSDAKPVVVEVKAYLWQQVDGQDKLTPTTDLVITPPLAEITGNSTQLIRVGRRSTVKAGPIERTYRIAIQEVVPTAESARPGLHFALRLSLPVFIAPVLADDELGRPRFEWSISPADKGQLAVQLKNSGTVHAQVINFAVLGPTGAPLAAQADMTYVLPGQSRRYLLKAAGAALPASGAPLTIKAATDAGDQLARVALTHP